MANAEDIQLRMPSVAVLVSETLARPAMRAVRSQLFKLPEELLHGLCMRLIDKALTFADCWEWLNAELLAIGERAIDDNAVYRFKDNFLPVYQQVRSEHVRRIARLTIDQVHDGHIGNVNRVTKVRLSELFAEKLLDVDDIDALDTKQVSNIISALGAYDAGEMKQREFELKLADAEQKREKAEAELAIKRQQLQKLPEQVKRLSEQVDQLKKRTARGDKIDPAIFSEMEAQLVALRHIAPDEEVPA